MLRQWLPELSALRTLNISSSTECSDNAVTVSRCLSYQPYKLVAAELSKVNLMLAMAKVFLQSVSEESTLKRLRIEGVDGCSLQMQIFGFDTDREWPLSALITSGCMECCAEAVTRLIDVLKHKPLKKLKLSQIHLTSAAAEALSQSLPELSALQALRICGMAECSSRAVTSLIAAIKHKTLNELTLSEINVTAAVAEALGQSLWELSALQTLEISVSPDCSAEAVTSLAAAFKHKTFNVLKLNGIKLTLEVAEALVQSLWELSALQTLEISVSTDCSAEAGSILAAVFKHKPLREFKLSGIKLTLEAAEAIGQSLLEVSDLRLHLFISGFAQCSTKEASRLLEVAIPSRKFKSIVIPHAGCSKFIVKPL